MVHFKTFQNSIEAQMFFAKLLENGVQAYLFDENANQLYHTESMLMGVRVMVGESDVEAAKAIDSQWQAMRSSELKYSCPKCGSGALVSNYSLPLYAKKGKIKKMWGELLELLWPQSQKLELHCKECGYDFSSNESGNMRTAS